MGILWIYFGGRSLGLIKGFYLRHEKKIESFKNWKTENCEDGGAVESGIRQGKS